LIGSLIADSESILGNCHVLKHMHLDPQIKC
jgi:hypothetical protein